MGHCRIKRLVENGADIYSVESKTGASVLHKAVYSGNPDVVQYLVDKGFNAHRNHPADDLLKDPRRGGRIAGLATPRLNTTAAAASNATAAVFPQAVRAMSAFRAAPPAAAGRTWAC